MERQRPKTEEVQRAVVGAKLRLAAHAPQPSSTVVPRGFKERADASTGCGGRAKCHPANHRVDRQPSHRADRSAASARRSELSEGDGVEEIESIAAVDAGEIVADSIGAAKSMHIQELLGTAPLTRTERRSQRFDASAYGILVLRIDVQDARGSVQKQFDDDRGGGVQHAITLPREAADAGVKSCLMFRSERAKRFQKLTLALRVDEHRVERDHRVQTKPRELIAPRGYVGLGRGDEVEDRDDRPSAPGENGQFVAMATEHALTSINDVDRDIAREHLSDGLRFLRKPSLRIGKPAEDALMAILDLLRQRRRLQMLEQSAGILESGRVGENERRRFDGQFGRF